MSQVPIVLTADGPVLLGRDEEGEPALTPFSSNSSVRSRVPLGVVNLDPCAVFFGARLQVAAAPAQTLAANRATVHQLRPRGERFEAMPPGEMSGYPHARSWLVKHRAEVPEVDTIRTSAIFAVSTVRTSIVEAEKSYRCFGELYRKAGRQMPEIEGIKRCFAGLQNEKARVFQGVFDYAPTVREVMKMGYRDRELRSVLALDDALPRGLGLAKLSFTLALLGQDTICLDARLLSKIFPDKKERGEFERKIGKQDDGRVSTAGLLLYEAVEDAFLEGNRYYDPEDPIGRARAQWLSWESVGKKGASHGVWIEMLEAP